jgi:protein-tyrosine phosphatase
MPKFHFRQYEAVVTESLSRGSAKSEAQLADLKRRGFNAVINLRGEDNSDEAACAKLGLEYFHLPLVDDTVPTPEQMFAMLDFMTKPRPVPFKGYVHCTAGVGRTGVAVAVSRMALEGWPAQKALDEALKYQLHIPAQAEFILQFGAALEARRGRA